jgi:hypothetical protein
LAKSWIKKVFLDKGQKSEVMNVKVIFPGTGDGNGLMLSQIKILVCGHFLV